MMWTSARSPRVHEMPHHQQAVAVSGVQHGIPCRMLASWMKQPILYNDVASGTNCWGPPGSLSSQCASKVDTSLPAAPPGLLPVTSGTAPSRLQMWPPPPPPALRRQPPAGHRPLVTVAHQLCIRVDMCAVGANGRTQLKSSMPQSCQVASLE